MGTGCGKNEPKKSMPQNRQQTSSEQNRRNSNRARAPTVESSELPVLKNMPPVQRVTHDREQIRTPIRTVPVQSRTPPMANGLKNLPSTSVTPNSSDDAPTPALKNEDDHSPSSSDGDDDDGEVPFAAIDEEDNEDEAPAAIDEEDHEDEAPAASNVQSKSDSNSKNKTLPPAISLISTSSTTPTNPSTHTNTKILWKSIEPTGRCSECPHCQLSSEVIVSETDNKQRPKWITTEAPPNAQQIHMSNYDEEAFQKKLSKYSCITGSYDYPPNLTIQEEENSSFYHTFPAIVKIGSSITPTHTPFPNYATLQRRERRFNKPHEPSLFTD